MNMSFLHDAINNVCPIISVRIGNLLDKTTWQFIPVDGVTDQQKAAAQSIIDGWDGSASANEKLAAKDAMTHSTPLVRLMRCSDRVTYKSVVQMRQAFNGLLDILAQGRFPTTQEKTSLKLPIRTWSQLKQTTQAEIDTDDPNN
jgi:hypothetical protein